MAIHIEHSMKCLFYINALFVLFGCVGGISTSQCLTCSVTVWDSYGTGGTIYSDKNFGDETSVYSVARAYCAERGLGPPNVGSRLDVLRNNSNWEYGFSCVDTKVVTPTPLENQEVDRLRAEAEASRLRQRQLEQQLNQSRQQPIAPVQAATPTSVDRLSLDASKKKCGDLGFKPGTEGFGKCVLQLSK